MYFWGSDNVLASYRFLEDSATGSDKLSTDKLPYVYFNLSNTYHQYKPKLTKRIKEMFNKKYKYEVKEKAQLFIFLKLNCRLLNKIYLYPFFWIIISFLSFDRSRFLVKKYLND